MKIAIVGGGPAGLYFAYLMKRANARSDITVIEQNAPDATYGFGVVFSDTALTYLADADPDSYAVGESVRRCVCSPLFRGAFCAALHDRGCDD